MDRKQIFNKFRRIFEPILLVRSYFTIHCLGGGRALIKGRCHSLFAKCYISVSGRNNIITFGDMCQIRNTHIIINGNNNIINLGALCYIDGVSICIEDSNNTISIGRHCYIHNNTEISAIEGTEIRIGEDCLFSSDIIVRTGDSHSIIDVKTNKRINASQNITLGEHVWVGKRAMILKGSNIGPNSVVGAGAIVTKASEYQNNCVLAGIPARVIKNEINWMHIRS